MSDWKATRKTDGPLSSIRVWRTNRTPDSLFVLCHGFGAPGDDLVGLVDHWIPRFDASNICPLMIFPAGPIDLTDEGMPGGRAWWRINMAHLMQMAMAHSFDEIRNEVPPGIESARKCLELVVEETRREFLGVDLPLVIGGFSQGAMLAVEYSLMSDQEPPQGLVVLSGALISEKRWRDRGDRLESTKVFQSHGMSDTVLPIESGKALSQLLRDYSDELQWLEAPGPHYVPAEANVPICDLLASVVSESAARTNR